MNQMHKVLEMLGLEVEEKFNVVDLTGLYPEIENSNPFKFDKEYKLCDKFGFKRMLVEPIIRGEFEIEKLPFKPKDGDTYWSYIVDADGNGYATSDDFYENSIGLTDWYVGNCFRTKQEAETQGKKLIEELYKEYNKVGGRDGK